jgi:hypothetical protein
VAAFISRFVMRRFLSTEKIRADFRRSAKKSALFPKVWGEPMIPRELKSANERPLPFCAKRLSSRGRSHPANTVVGGNVKSRPVTTPAAVRRDADENVSQVLAFRRKH